MKTRSVVLGFFILIGGAAQAERFESGIDYPLGPQADMTPGSVCTHPDYLRHPERIPYCERSVDTSTKKAIIAEYDERFRYRIRQMPRGEFKIDHLIPLCIGGSNNTDNLWPQHETTFLLTDPVEHRTCELVSQGKLKQKDAIEMVLKAKAEPARAPRMLESLHFNNPLNLSDLNF